VRGVEFATEGEHNALVFGGVMERAGLARV
jgi:hypothetical protein